MRVSDGDETPLKSHHEVGGRALAESAPQEGEGIARFLHHRTAAGARDVCVLLHYRSVSSYGINVLMDQSA
jgi:hypothetical protein